MTTETEPTSRVTRQDTTPAPCAVEAYLAEPTAEEKNRSTTRKMLKVWMDARPAVGMARALGAQYSGVDDDDDDDGAGLAEILERCPLSVGPGDLFPSDEGTPISMAELVDYTAALANVNVEVIAELEAQTTTPAATTMWWKGLHAKVQETALEVALKAVVAGVPAARTIADIKRQAVVEAMTSATVNADPNAMDSEEAARWYWLEENAENLFDN